MTQPNTTPVPNVLFDHYIKALHLAELKVLLVIIRQTLGWSDKKAVYGRKEWDWISSGQLQLKTGSSRRSISSAIEVLALKKLIIIRDEYGNTLDSTEKRKGKQRLFFSLSPTLISSVENMGITGANHEFSGLPYAKLAEDLSKKRTALAQKMRITKETLQN